MEIKIYKGTVEELRAAGLLDNSRPTQGKLFQEEKTEDQPTAAPLVHRSLAEAMRYNGYALDNGQYEALRSELAKTWPPTRKKRSHIVVSQADIETAAYSLQRQGYRFRIV